MQRHSGRGTPAAGLPGQAGFCRLELVGVRAGRRGLMLTSTGTHKPLLAGPSSTEAGEVRERTCVSGGSWRGRWHRAVASGGGIGRWHRAVASAA